MTRLFFFFLLFPILANAQEIFQKEIIHNTLSFSVFDMVKLPDKSYMACGYIVPNPQDSSLAIVAKMDSMLQVQWCKRIKILEKDYFRCITPLSDGNFLVGGTSRSEFSTFYGGNLYKIDASGNIIWNKLYSKSFDDATMGIFEQTDNTLVVFIRHGVFGQPTKILKTDSNGNLLNEFTIYNEGSTIGVLGDCVAGNESDEYFLGGTVYNPTLGKNIYFIAKTTDNALLWYNEYDFGRDFAQLFGITVLSDGNVVVSGNIADTVNTNITHAGLLKVDQNTGSVIWAKEIQQPEAFTMSGYGIFSLDAGEMMLCSRATTNNGVQAYAAKLDADGNIFWAREYGSGSYNGFGLAITLSAGRYLFAGTNELYGGTYFVQTDSDGFSPCFTDVLNLTSTEQPVNVFSPIRELGDPEVEVMSPAFEETPITLSENIFCSGTVAIEERPKTTQFKIYPNPANHFIMIENMIGQTSSISIEIYNTQGLLIYHSVLNHQKEVVKTQFISGLYFIIIKNSQKDVLDYQKFIIR